MVRSHFRALRALAPVLACLAAALALDGCATWSRRVDGGAVDSTSDGLAGGLVASQSGPSARAAIAGAIMGGAAGAFIANQMDQQARELRVAIPDARVARVGEGIELTLASNTLFDIDSDRVRTEAGARLHALVTSLDKYPGTSIIIIGHSDASGTAEHNQALSLRRATSVSAFVAQQGVSPSRVQVAGRGELEPIAPNDTEAGRRTNRRVEIIIVANANARRTAAP
ncbi:MAG: OmpA family protein [Gemmatimonadetes bacterium]|nr:OmpA family protein [Gemmatimonadota bacterium]